MKTRTVSSNVARLLTGTGLVMGALLAAAPLHAQEASATDAADEDAVILVTGSRIQRDGYDQPTPVTVATTEDLLLSVPTSIADGLNRLPQFSGSRSRTFCCEVSSVGNYLNLRGLGTTRTLVLLDSRRVVPTRESGDVDVNLLPELLIQRVDVVTGGASAAYGSDAVSGVVNYVIDNRFEGIKANGQLGISNYGDDETVKLGIAGGASFSEGRGHFVIGVEHFRIGGISSLNDRPTSRRGALLAGNGTAATPYETIGGARHNVSTYGGVIINAAGLPVANAGAPLAGTKFLTGGAASAFQFGTAIPGSPAFSVGGDGILNNLADPAQSLETQKIYSRLSYDFSDNLTAYVRVNAGVSKTEGDVLADHRSGAAAYTIFRNNAYLPAAIAQQMDLAGVQSFRLARFNRDIGPMRLDYVNNTFDVNLGLEGKLGDAWSWAVSYGHGETRLKGRVHNVSNLAKLYAAADAVVDPVSGNIVCNVTLTNPGAFPGCVPMNLFGEGAPSQASKAYAFGTSSQFVKNTQDVFAAEIQGDVFELPAGPVSVALGAEYRERSLLEKSNEIAVGQIQATGIRGFPGSFCPTLATCRYGGWNQGNFGTADASDNVKEGFIEALVPLLRDAPLAEELDLNAAFRYTDYKNSGGVETWKIGLSYKPFEDLRIRAARSRDIRAPNLFELFAGPVNAFQPGLTDPLTGQTNVIAVTRTQGNPNLKPEKADTLTVGFVYTPSWLPGFSGSVDYYEIDISGALSATTSQGTLDACQRGDTVACSLITRDPSTSAIQQIVLQQINLNSRLARGIDFDLSYRSEIGSGELGARAQFSRTLDYIDTVGGVKTQQAGFYNTGNQLSLPKWRGNVSLDYTIGAFSLFVQERYIGSITQMPPLPGQVFAKPKIGAVFYTDITATMKVQGLGGDFEIYGTVNNLFNRKPPFIGNRFAAGLGFPTPPNLYDLDNRYFTVGARVKF